MWVVWDGDYWIFNGVKIFISGVDKVDYGIVFVCMDLEKGCNGIMCFIVDWDMLGFYVCWVVYIL